MSRRQYITQEYLTAYMNQPLNGDFGTADALIEMAEQMVDGYVGSQRKWFQLDSSFVAGIYTPPDYEPETPVVKELRGRITEVIDQSHYMIETWQQYAYQNDFFIMCNVDIMGGTAYGNSYIISASTYGGQITLINTDGSAITGEAPLDTTSIYRIYQLGKFPRDRDVFYNTFVNPTFYQKLVPEAVREATAAQCEFINAKGINFFVTDAASLQSEHIGNYSYTRRPDASDPLIAPKAKMLLRGIRSRRGTMII